MVKEGVNMLLSEILKQMEVNDYKIENETKFEVLALTNFGNR